MEVERKYGVQTDIYFPLIVAGGNDFADGGDYTHASGDVKISKDGGAAATATNSPSAIAMGNCSMWKLTLTATEMSAAKIIVTISDAATKAVEDQMILVTTYGNPSAEHAVDRDDAVRAGMTALPNAAADAPGGLVISDDGGLDIDAVRDLIVAYLDAAISSRSDFDHTSDTVIAGAAVAAFLADFFEVDSGKASGAAIEQSVVKEIADLVDSILTSAHGSGSWAGSSSDIVATTGTISGTPTSQQFDTNLTEADDIWNKKLLIITSGTYAGQHAWIEDYQNTNGVIVLSEPLLGAPSASDTFKILHISAIPMSLERSPR